ncbi:MAG: hypothetical protein ACOQNV_01335 [Mycoplasmoidaceae bacterium]
MKKNNKKLVKIIAPVALASGCLATIPAASCSTSMYKGLKHLAPYLHELTFNDYVYDKDFVTTKDAEAFGCSSVRNGDFYGRNFDYVFNNTPEFVVKMKANKEKHRHASIGIATHFGLRENKLLKGEYKEQLSLVPNITLDGINDAGVICSHNVVSMEPTTVDETTYTAETQPDNQNAKQLHMLFIPRYVLDNASSAAKAVELLTSENLNIKGALNNNYYLHVMIADAKETYVVEFFHKKSSTHNHFDVVVDKKGTEAGHLPIMTNYYVNNGNNDFVNDKKYGEERYAILEDGYNTATSFSGMESLMQRVMFSKAYNYRHNPVPMKVTTPDKGDLTSEWYSEFVVQSELYPYTGAFDYQKYLLDFVLFKQDYWNARLLDYRVPANPNYWQTTHNSTYDIRHKHLRVVVQEQYETYFDYYL